MLMTNKCIIRSKYIRGKWYLNVTRLVDKSLNVCRGDSVPTLPAIPAVFSRDCWPDETTALHDY